MNGKVSLVVAVVVLAPIAAGVPVAASANGGQQLVTQTFEVVDTQGNPIQGVTLNVTWDGGSATATTRANGKALVDVPEGVSLDVGTSHPDYVRNDEFTVPVSSGEGVTQVEMHAAATVAVTVEDASGSVSNARVELRKRGQPFAADTGTTGGNGLYRSGPVEEGSYTVIVRKSGYFTKTLTALLRNSGALTVPIEEGSKTVSFTVVDDQFETPQALQAEITVTSGGETIGTFTTDRNGQRGVTLDVNSRYSVSITKEGYETVSDTFRLGESEISRRYNISRTPTLTLSPDNTRLIVGQNVRLEVRDEYGNLVNGAAILADGSERATTDENGVARVKLDQAATVNVTARKDGVTSDPVSIEWVKAAAEETSTATPTATATGTGTATATPTTASTPTESDLPDLPVSTPGFTPLAAILALVLSLVLLRRRR